MATRTQQRKPGAPNRRGARQSVAPVTVKPVIIDPDSRLLYRLGSPEVVIGLVIMATLGGFAFRGSLDTPGLASWATVFVSTFIQAFPFLALGVALSATIATFVSSAALERVIPKRPIFAVPSAGLAGMCLPGCECGAVPIAGRLMGGGARPAVALTFLLAAPAVNPVVLVSTAVAFPNQPIMVLARYLASIGTAIIMGFLWINKGREDLVTLRPTRSSPTDRKWDTARNVMVHDFSHAGGYLVAGAMAAAGFQVLVPENVITTVADNWLLSIVLMAALAILLSLCSEADAFVAASLPGFNNTSRLVFMVVGPAVDVKLFAMQAGVFGRRFAYRFAPTTLVVAVGMSVLVGWLLL